MFIDLTRHGGGRVLRIASAAIAYLDACEGGTAVHLVGGETLRVAEDPATIEARAVPDVTSCELVAAPSPTLEEIVSAVGHAFQAHFAPAPAASRPQLSTSRKDR